MGRRFHEVSGLTAIPFDDVSAVNTLSKLMDARGLLVMTAPDGRAIGMAGVFAAPSYWNSHFTTAGTIFIWIDPENRGAGDELREAVEARARELGAGVLIFACLEAQKADAMTRWYRSHGYAVTEHYFMKEL